ncbi:MAG: hypothetical protein EAX96_03415 [Candidatus Lokiarchaeota archaeon]|nr:hypothetical protein [Candidatus Lokiarchaeota archaeon]
METLQHKDYWQKSVPVLIIGFAIWGFTSFFFESLIMNSPPSLFIFLIVVYFAVWFGVIALTFSNHNVPAMCLFYLSSFITGLITTPIFNIILAQFGTVGAARLFTAVSMVSIASLTGAFFFGAWVKKRVTEDVELHWGKALLIGGLLLLIIEPTIAIIYGGDLILFWTSFIVLIWMYAAGIYYGMALDEEIERNNWMYFVLSYFLTLINIIIRLLYIISALTKNN